MPCFVQGFIGTHVHRSNGDWQALHAFHGSSVLLKLLFFTWQITLPAHEQKLASKKTDTHSAHSDRGVGVFWHFNVGQQFNFLTVQGHGGRVTQSGEALAF